MYLQVPKDTIVFISGVPGSGKTTVAYELFKNYCDFRIVEETDIIREILRGYRKHLALMGISIPDEITPHNVFLDYATASRQCEVMMNSIIAIVHRQQRKEIPTIINGVHIIPEILYDNMLFSSHIAYVNLFIESEDLLWTRLRNRDPQKYKKEGVPFLYRMNLATVYKGNIIKNLIMDCQSYTKYRPNETTGGIFVSWRRKEELPTGA